MEHCRIEPMEGLDYEPEAPEEFELAPVREPRKGPSSESLKEEANAQSCPF